MMVMGTHVCLLLDMLLSSMLALGSLVVAPPARAAGSVLAIYSGALASGGRLVFTVSDGAEPVVPPIPR
jgi:hypothetical protein